MALSLMGPARIVDVSGMDDQELAEFVSSSFDPEYPESGFCRSVYRGEVFNEEGWGHQDFAEIKFCLDAKFRYDVFVLTADECQSGPSDTMREHGVELVAGLSRIWRPDYLSLQDNALDLMESQYWKRHDSKRRSWPRWGYVSYLSDRIADSLDKWRNVKGASVTRFGTGWLLVSDTWDITATANMWDRLHDKGCLRHVEMVQDWEPQFPDETAFTT